MNALQELQEEHDGLEDDFDKELAALEAKYAALYKPLYAQRALVVSGEKEIPPGPSDPPDEPVAGEAEVGTKGVPSFWLHAMRNVDVLAEKARGEGGGGGRGRGGKGGPAAPEAVGPGARASRCLTPSPDRSIVPSFPRSHGRSRRRTRRCSSTSRTSSRPT